MKEIQLTKGYVAIVDDEDYALVSQYTWRAQVKRSGTVYAQAHIRQSDGERVSVSMHRMIMGVIGTKAEVDHVNRNGLDNRRDNMRTCTSAQNQQNKGIRKDNTSGFKGVTWYERGKKWQARITASGKVMRLGRFALIDDAVAAYQAAALKYHGEFARF